MDNGYSLADISAATGGNNGFGGFGGEGLWLFAILALMGGGFGNFGNRNSTVTEADICNANSFSELKGAVRGVSEQINNTSKGICDLGYATLAKFGDLEKQLCECCCQGLRAVDSVRFDMANYAASINANTTAGIQKVIDYMAADKAMAQAQRINQLEMEKMLCGIIKFPTTFSYQFPCPPAPPA